MSNADTTKAVLSMLSAAPFGNKKKGLDDVNNTAWRDEVQAWHAQIGHLDIDVARQAASMVISECEWWPTIAKYLECVRSILRAQEASLAKAPVLLTDAARKIQQQALAAQRDIASRRTQITGGLSKGHNHSAGHLACPICVQALNERQAEDECSTCFILDSNELHASHHR